MHHGRARRLAAGIALIVPAVFAAEQRPAVPAGVDAACSAAYNVGVKTPGTRMQRSNGLFREEMVTAPIEGCRVIINGSMQALGKERLPTDRLSDLLEKQGWVQVPEFSADGHDGTTFAYKRANAACVVRGEWDGGSDDEPDAPLADSYRVTVVCGNAAALVRPQ